MDLTLDAELGEAAAPDEEQLGLRIAASLRRTIEKNYPPHNRPVRRDAHPKAHGCVRAEFRVEKDLPAKLAHGVFRPGAAYQAWIRFSNADGNPKRADVRGDARGMAIKLVGVPGEKILPDERDAKTHDFMMIDHPTFLVDDPRRYLKLIEWSTSESLWLRLFAPFAIGMRGALIGRAIRTKTIASPLETRYWSATAYRLGAGQEKSAIKFSARPSGSPSRRNPPQPDRNFLRDAMSEHLAERDAHFDFLVQPRTSPALSVERSMFEWNEAGAPFYKVATITIPRQTFASPAQEEFGENLSFTPWHALPEHRPLGVVNRVRRVVYEELSRFRHELNGVPRREPTGGERFD
jgi:hypothetical protein